MNTFKSIQNENTKAFAVACYDMNTLAELLEARKGMEADAVDMRTWGLTETQWIEAIEAALYEQLRTWVLDEFVPGCDANGVNPEHVIAEFENAPEDDGYIDEEGDIGAGRGLFDLTKMVGFYEWEESK